MATGTLKVPKIKGESRLKGHEDEIDIDAVSFGVVQHATRAKGGGHTGAHASFGDLVCSKTYDAASPYLALACMNAQAFDEVVFTARKDSGEEHLDYLIITLTDCILTSYNASGGFDSFTESFSISFKNIGIKYTVQKDDQTGGDEHEVEYNLMELA
ncbi:MAG TPA: type VI secretion system tube protein Hcp [Paracoccus sp. (in: a-proteobacteria)]|uniref:Hcp family type VI secretion system effector n=1 Tax=Paracoccus sp. TaxID=267 RepID=UPI002B7A9E5B|nr:type VI secretion system tube protein Hcp [Paracoccus sp. (in: a-proteobacteria)]HWL56733.1 type VI secretion system tube protein Hcp [Paracoccus sp. (in: a-proteobacteria)]